MRLTDAHYAALEERQRAEDEAWEAARPALRASAEAKLIAAYRAHRGCQLTADEVMALQLQSGACDSFYFRERQITTQFRAAHRGKRT